ncbi:MAG: M6 family metalloprotease domain-containing protein [Magnetococcales bacterium]|nr:M6 family metalloprotease domain-containing protein [Magnetococcales bacterium]
MKPKKISSFLRGIRNIYRESAGVGELSRHAVMPHPDLQARIRKELAGLRRKGTRLLTPMLRLRRPTPTGMNDGLIFPGTLFPPGTPPGVVRSAAADRAPLRGDVRVLVILVEFSDLSMKRPAAEFEELFFSRGTLSTGSVREYYLEASGGLVNIVGQVVGPYRLSSPMHHYAHGASGMGQAAPNARNMAREAMELVQGVDFARYDNDGNGFVDALVLIHAGPDAERTGNPEHLWSHKWVLSGGPHDVDGIRLYAYLTIPEEARVGVCAHELGHILFGWIDFYDTDCTSSGLGNWCLMAGGSWNNDGATPAHPSAYCKADQGWVKVERVDREGLVAVADVQTGRKVYALWRDGLGGQEYFLLENRRKKGFDAYLPGEGLLIYHVDDSIGFNTDESHPKVALMQADGRMDLETGANRGDDGDVFPGSTGNARFAGDTTPGSRAYNGRETGIGVLPVGQEGEVVKVRFLVGGALPPSETPPGGGGGADLVERDGSRDDLAALEVRVRALEEAVMVGRPFIDRELRAPVLCSGFCAEEERGR